VERGGGGIGRLPNLFLPNNFFRREGGGTKRRGKKACRCNFLELRERADVSEGAREKGRFARYLRPQLRCRKKRICGVEGHHLGRGKIFWWGKSSSSKKEKKGESGFDRKGGPPDSLRFRRGGDGRICRREKVLDGEKGRPKNIGNQFLPHNLERAFCFREGGGERKTRRTSSAT